MTKLKLGIIGHGFVGKATDFGFNKNIEKYIVDPKLGTNIQDLEDFKPDIIFICVPTPMSDDGSQDSSIIEKVINELIITSPSSVKVIKSTVLPSVLERVAKLDNKIIYNPEFLREKHANKDFINSEMIILGGEKKSAVKVSAAYNNHSRCITANFVFTDLTTASLIKYSINTFLATKVVYFNELNSVFEKMNVKDKWETVVDVIAQDSRIGSSHMNVPGHDGRKGFGGACFPKDSLAFAKYAQSLGVGFSLLEKAIKVNNKIRSDYTDLDSREAEQNVSFDDKI